MKYVVDDTGALEKLFEEIMEKYFPGHKKLNYVYAWRDKEKYKDGKLILAEVIRCSPRDRDLFGKDVRIVVCETNFPSKKHARRKLAYHELKHIELVFKDNGKVKKDKEGRIVFKIVPHDLDIRRFEDELIKFGLDEGEEVIRKQLNAISKKHSEKGK